MIEAAVLNRAAEIRAQQGETERADLATRIVNTLAKALK